MAGLKNKAKSVLHLFLFICFMTVAVHAGTGKRSFYPGDSGLFANDYLPRASNPVAAEPGRPLKSSLDPGAGVVGDWLAERDLIEGSQGLRQVAGYGPRSGSGALAVLTAVIGNVVGMVAGIYLANLDLGGGRVGDPIVGALAGSVCGSTLGVYLAGRAVGRRGKFGSALLGSLLGEVAAVVLFFAVPSEEFPFLAGFLVLPPMGAAIAFNGSLRSRESRAGSGILNLAGGELELGVPDIQVRPSSIPGFNAKPELQFNVRVLSVEL